MSKVLTFSRYFPAYHPKAGQPTFFVEKITHSLQLLKPKMSESFFETLTRLNPSVKYKAQIDFFVTLKWDKKTPKHHTIRAGHRFKAGDKFSPRVWSGKPYRSKQIIIDWFDYPMKPFDGQIICWNENINY